MSEPRWHRVVKEVVKSIGESKGYDVSESEREMMFSSRFAMFNDEEKAIHTSLYKPDVVWKSDYIYRAIFEIEYLNPKSSQIMEKRKYSIGSLMLAHLAVIRKSIRHLVFITNSEQLCREIAKFIELAEFKPKENIWYLYEPLTTRSSLTKSLDKDLSDWKI